MLGRTVATSWVLEAPWQWASGQVDSLGQARHKGVMSWQDDSTLQASAHKTYINDGCTPFWGMYGLHTCVASHLGWFPCLP